MGRTGSTGNRRSWRMGILAAVMLGTATAQEHSKFPLPSYHYGAKIPVECLNRSM